jgi:hypothetical protein
VLEDFVDAVLWIAFELPGRRSNNYNAQIPDHTDLQTKAFFTICLQRIRVCSLSLGYRKQLPP